VLCALIACHTPAAGLTEVRVALTRDGITWLPVLLAHALGYDHEEGLEFVLSEVAGMSKGVEALMGGSVEVTAGALAQTIQAASEGAATRLFINFYSRPIQAIAVAPAMTGTIRQGRDLKGHSVGVSTPGSATHQFLNAFLVANGLSPDEVSAVPVGTAATSIAALERNKVDAAVLVGSAIPMVKQRNPAILLLADTRTPEGARLVFGTDTFPNTGLVARDRWLHAERRRAAPLRPRIEEKYGLDAPPAGRAGARLDAGGSPDARRRSRSQRHSGRAARPVGGRRDLPECAGAGPEVRGALQRQGSRRQDRPVADLHQRIRQERLTRDRQA